MEDFKEKYRKKTREYVHFRETECGFRLYDENYVDWLEQQLKNCNLQNVSVLLLHQKAIEYAKFIHQEEFDDPCFAPDVEQTIRDFKSGFEAAIRYSNER